MLAQEEWDLVKHRRATVRMLAPQLVSLLSKTKAKESNENLSRAENCHFWEDIKYSRTNSS